jgi:hypothetical protein
MLSKEILHCARAQAAQLEGADVFSGNALSLLAR